MGWVQKTMQSKRVVTGIAAALVFLFYFTSLRAEIPPVPAMLWEGLKAGSLNGLAEVNLKGLSVEQKAHVDWIRLTYQSGSVVYLPRAFLVKVPKLKVERGETPGSFRLKVPESEKAVLAKESYWFSDQLEENGLQKIEWVSFWELFGALRVQSRSDPGLIKGERWFALNCVGCHGVPNALKNRSLAGHKNPSFDGVLKQTSLRPLERYLEEIQKRSSQASRE